MHKIIISMSCLMMSASFMFAQTTIPYMTGINGESNKGSQTNPYKISSARDLDTLSYFVRNGGGRCGSTHFKMTNNIDMSVISGVDARGYAFNRSGRPNDFCPIGGRNAVENSLDISNSTNLTYAFAGNFDGNNYVIANLKMTGNKMRTGMFNCAKEGAITHTIKNLGFTNAEVVAGRSSGVIIGILPNGTAASSITYTYIDNCYVENSTLTTTSGYCGIIAGEDSPMVTNSYVKNCTINAIGGETLNYIGAFIGDGERGTIEFCYVQDCIVNVTGTQNRIGGFCGDVDRVVIKSCFVTNTQVNSSTNEVGGFFGQFYSASTIENCYTTATVTRTGGSGTLFGGFCGTGAPTAASSFYISSWSPQGLSNAGGGTVKTEAEMKAAAFVTTLNATSGGTNPWMPDFTGAWDGGVNYGYPRFGTEIPFIISDGMTITLNDPADVTNRPSTVIIQEGGSLINNTANAMTNVTVERNLFNERWAFVGSPLYNFSGPYIITAGAYLGNLTGGNNYLNIETNQAVSLLDFNYSTNMWANNWGWYTYLGYNSGMITGLGYLAYVLDSRYDGNLGDPYQNINNRGAAVKHKIIGTLDNTSSLSFISTLTNTGNVNTIESATDGRWFALSNPYPGNIYAKNFKALNADMYGNYVYTLAANNVWEAQNATDNTGKIKIGHGFFVAGKSTTFTPSFTKSMMNPPAKTEQEKIKYITIVADNKEMAVEACFAINRNSSNGFDDYDAYKIFSSNETVSEPYFIVDSNAIQINTIKTMPYECPLNIRSHKDYNNFLLYFDNIPDNVEMYLIDGTDTIEVFNSFSYNTGIRQGYNEGRFKVKFAESQNSLPDAVREASMDIWVASNVLNINGENLKTISIYNTLGQVIYQKNISGNAYSDVLNLPNGIYTAKAESKNGSKTYKFVINK